MRVLSFIPAFLLAATSFAASIPAGTTPPAVPSCVPSTGAPSGNDAALQPIISIIQNATLNIQPLHDKLSSVNAGSPDVQTVDGIVVGITAVVQTCIVQLRAAVKVELSGLSLVNLGVAIYALLGLVCDVLQILFSVVLKIGAGVAVLKGDITALLNVVVSLVACLRIYVVADLAVVLGPVLTLVANAVAVLLAICANVQVLVGVA